MASAQISVDFCADNAKWKVQKVEVKQGKNKVLISYELIAFNQEIKVG